MNPLDALAAILLLLVPFNWAVSVFLLVLNHRAPNLPTLKSRAFSQVILAVGATIAGFFGAIRLLNLTIWPNVTTVLLAVALLVLSLPAINWAVIYLSDGFE